MVKLNQNERRRLEERMQHLHHHIEVHEELGWRAYKEGNMPEYNRHMQTKEESLYTLIGMDEAIQMLGYIRDWDADHNVKIHKIGE